MHMVNVEMLLACLLLAAVGGVEGLVGLNVLIVRRGVGWSI